MNSENAIEVKNITKTFKIYPDKGNTLKERALFSYRRRFERREVLKGISFDVKKGEAVGLIGHNGCGKSTTLKLLTRIMYPDSGTIEMRGRVSSLIELGAGFHPDMSGRENIYINASIFGLSRKEIDSRIEDIIEFSELDEFIDNPVRTYSSGMYMRLAFSVAINVDADILLIDEILAVGDTAFQNKCFNKLKQIKADGTTIVIVSHSLGQIEQICERSIWIHDGYIKAEGPPLEVDTMYLDYISKRDRKKPDGDKRRAGEKNDPDSSASGNKQRYGNGKARITSVKLLDSNGDDVRSFSSGESIDIEICYNVREVVKDACFGIGIFRYDGLNCYGSNTRIDKIGYFDLTGDGNVRVHLPNIELLSGRYKLDIAIEQEIGVPVDYYKECCIFDIVSLQGDIGISRIRHEWIFEKRSGQA